jgi:hypothetical protein
MSIRQGVEGFRGREYGEHEAVIGIEDLRLIAGSSPARAFGLVEECALLHQADLAALWLTARQSNPLNRIDPLP